MKLDFEEAGNLLEANRGATTITIEDEDVNPEQRNAAVFTPDRDDEDPLASDDKTEVWTRLTLSENVFIFMHFQMLLHQIVIWIILFFSISFCFSIEASLWAKEKCPVLDVWVLPKIFRRRDPSRNINLQLILMSFNHCGN